MSPILSVIIPVYNVEPYINRCIDSILNQPFEDIELILVDDGSPDNCGKICDDYAKQDKRINVIHKANGGLSSARNAGIDIAKGEYITFVDSDDTISEQTYSLNMPILINDKTIDLIVFPVFVHYSSPKQFIHKIEARHVYNEKDIFTHWISNKGYVYAYAWNKIYKRSLFENIKFPDKKKFEDVYTIPLIISQINHIYYSNSGLYYYYSTPSSISNTYCYDNFHDLIEANIKLLNLVKRTTQRNEEILILYLHISNMAIDIYRAMKKEKIQSTSVLKEIKGFQLSLPELFKLKIPLYTKLKNITLCVFGLHIHCKLFSLTKSF